MASWTAEDMPEAYNYCFPFGNKRCLPSVIFVATVPGVNLGGRVKAEREARDWTQQHLCDLVGEDRLSQGQLSALENRDSKTSEAAPYIADAFGISLRWLLTGEGRREDTDWPFPWVKRSRWDACDDMARGYIQAAINRALDECEAQRTATSGKPPAQAA